MPIIDDMSVLTDSNDNNYCVLKAKKVIITEFKNITWGLAWLKRENKTLEEWRKVHINYFTKIDSNFNENTKVVFEIFEVIYKFK